MPPLPPAGTGRSGRSRPDRRPASRPSRTVRPMSSDRLGDGRRGGHARDRPIGRARLPTGQVGVVGQDRPDVAGRTVGGLVHLRAGPGRGARRGERAEGRGQDEQQRRARVAERSPGHLPGAERRDDPATAGRGSARRSRRGAGRAGSRARRRPAGRSRGAATRSGSTPSTPRAFRVSGAPYSRSCQSATIARTTRARSIPEPLGHRPSDLPAERGPDAGRAGLADERRQGQDGDAQVAGDDRTR